MHGSGVYSTVCVSRCFRTCKPYYITQWRFANGYYRKDVLLFDINGSLQKLHLSSLVRFLLSGFGVTILFFTGLNASVFVWVSAYIY
jgi:hypothetical protein